MLKHPEQEVMDLEMRMQYQFVCAGVLDIAVCWWSVRCCLSTMLPAGAS